MMNLSMKCQSHLITLSHSSVQPLEGNLSFGCVCWYGILYSCQPLRTTPLPFPLRNRTYAIKYVVNYFLGMLVLSHLSEFLYWFPILLKEFCKPQFPLPVSLYLCPSLSLSHIYTHKHTQTSAYWFTFA